MMTRQKGQLVWKVSLFTFALALVLLCRIPGDLAIAGIYLNSARDGLEQLSSVGPDRLKEADLRAVETRLAKAAAYDPTNPRRATRMAELVAYRQAMPGVENLSTDRLDSVLQALRGALADMPVSAVHWANLAQFSFIRNGLSDSVVYALDRAIEYGPLENTTLVVNAFITLLAWDDLDQQQRTRGWKLVLDSLNNPVISRQIMDIAAQSGHYNRLEVIRRSLDSRQQ